MFCRVSRKKIILPRSLEKHQAKSVFRLKRLFLPGRMEWPRNLTKENLPSVSNKFYGFNRRVTVISRDGTAERLLWIKVDHGKLVGSRAWACVSHVYVCAYTAIRYSRVRACVCTPRSIARGVKRWYSPATFSLFQRRLLHRHALRIRPRRYYISLSIYLAVFTSRVFRGVSRAFSGTESL